MLKDLLYKKTEQKTSNLSMFGKIIYLIRITSSFTIEKFSKKVLQWYYILFNIIKYTSEHYRKIYFYFRNIKSEKWFSQKIVDLRLLQESQVKQMNILVDVWKNLCTQIGRLKQYLIHDKPTYALMRISALNLICNHYFNVFCSTDQKRTEQKGLKSSF